MVSPWSQHSQLRIGSWIECIAYHHTLEQRAAWVQQVHNHYIPVACSNLLAIQVHVSHCMVCGPVWPGLVREIVMTPAAPGGCGWELVSNVGQMLQFSRLILSSALMHFSTISSTAAKCFLSLPLQLFSPDPPPPPSKEMMHSFKSPWQLTTTPSFLSNAGIINGLDLRNLLTHYK